MSIYRDPDIDVKVKVGTSALDDRGLSLKAKGIYAYLCSVREATLHDVVNHGTDKMYSVEDGLRELQETGYIEITENHKEYIYVIGDGYGNYKIGRTTDYEKRKKDYDTYLPYGPVLRILIATDGADIVERLLHQIFKHKKIKNEWFNLNEEEVAFIASYLT